MNKFKSFISKLRSNIKFREILYWSIVAFVLLYAFSIPSFSGREKWNIISYFLMGGLIGVTTLFVFLYSKLNFDRRMIIPLSFIAFAFFGTVFYSHEFRRWITLVLMAITMFVFYYAFLAINNKRLIFKLIVYAFLAFGLYFLLFYRDSLKNINPAYLRLGSHFDNVNTIGFYFSIAFTISFYTALMFKKKREVLYLLPTFIFFGLGFLTGSRAFILVMAIGAICVLYIRFRNKKLIFVIGLASMIGAFFILINVPALAFLKDQFERTMFTLFGIGNSKVDTSTVQRVIYPQYAWYLAGKNMIIGYGCNGFAIYSGVGTYAHNNYAEVICDFGVIGFVLYYLSFFVPMLYSFKPKEEDAFMVFVLVAIYLLRNFFGVTYYTKDSYLVLAMLFYLTCDCEMVKFPIFRKNRYANSNVYCEVNI